MCVNWMQLQYVLQTMRTEYLNNKGNGNECCADWSQYNIKNGKLPSYYFKCTFFSLFDSDDAKEIGAAAVIVAVIVTATKTMIALIIMKTETLSYIILAINSENTSCHLHVYWQKWFRQVRHMFSFFILF